MKRPVLVLILASVAVLVAVLLVRPSPDAGAPGPTTTEREAAPGPVVGARAPSGTEDRGSPDGASPSSKIPRDGTAPADPAPVERGAGSPEPAPEPSEQPDGELAPDAEPTVWPASGEGIRGAMAEALPKIKGCYERALKIDPEIAGEIVVAFTIGTADTASGVGQVTSVGIADATVEQTTMDDCLLDAMEDLQFDPPADGEMEVNYPFLFSVE